MELATFEDLHVLCVDDDPEAAELTATYLREELPGATVTTARDANGGMAVIEESEIDCVVSDYEMPGQSGLEFLRLVRTRDYDLPFILFTGKGSEEIASEAVSAGVTDYLQKRGPKQYELLANRVQNAISQWRAERDLERAREKTAQLHETAQRLREGTEPGPIFEHALAAASEVLEFDICGFFVVEDDRFVPEAVLNFPEDLDPLGVDQGVIGRTYRTGETVLVDDVSVPEEAELPRQSFRSCLSVPVGEHGVFQAISTEVGFFDERDRELADLLVSHVVGALDRIEYERDLGRTNDQLEALLENTTAHIYIKDLEGRYTLVNDQFADRLGRSRDEVIGRTDREIQDDDIAAEVRANDQAALERGEPIETEESAVWDGDRRIYYSVKAPIYDANGEPKAVCGVSSDITELKAHERELERKTERLDEFASVVSHDLRNPLTVAQGHLELLDDADEEVVAELDTSLCRMEEIIEDLLKLARGGRRISDTESVALATVAERAWTTVETGNAELVVDCDRRIEADRSRLQQLFENLFRNAVEHGATSSGSHARRDPVERNSGGAQRAEKSVERGSTSPREDGHGSPAVTVRVERTESGFAVADDGPGLPDGVGSELFSAEDSMAGTDIGFGLAIVERIAAAHGWAVSVDDDHDGARFEFEL